MSLQPYYQDSKTVIEIGKSETVLVIWSFKVHSHIFECMQGQCLSQDFQTGCLKLAVVKSLGVQIFKGDHNILRFQP